MDDSGFMPDGFYDTPVFGHPSSPLSIKPSMNQNSPLSPTFPDSPRTLNSANDNQVFRSRDSSTNGSFISDCSRDRKMRFESESPDELALVQAAKSYGCCLLKRSKSSVYVRLPGEYIIWTLELRNTTKSVLHPTLYQLYPFPKIWSTF